MCILSFLQAIGVNSRIDADAVMLGENGSTMMSSEELAPI